MAEILVYNNENKKAESINLDLPFEKREISEHTFSHAIRALLQNWRQGTVGCKTRAEVSFSNKKPWKQKGTGRARAGSARSPLWRKGGVAFGPQPRTRELSINKKQNKLVLHSLLFSALDTKTIHCLDYLPHAEKPTTKVAAAGITKSELNKYSKIVLFLDFNDVMSSASFRNIPHISIVYYDQPNAYNLSNSDCWVFLKKDLPLFKEMISQWN